MATGNITGAAPAASHYPVSDDPLMQAGLAYFALDQQIVGILRTLSDKLDGLRLQLQTRHSIADAFGEAVASTPAGASQIDFLQVNAADRDRVVAELTQLGLMSQITVVPLGGSPAIFTFRVDRAHADTVGDTLSQGLQSLLTTSQTQQLKLQNELARHSTLSETVGAFQKSYASVALSLVQSIGKG